MFAYPVPVENLITIGLLEDNQGDEAILKIASVDGSEIVSKKIKAFDSKQFREIIDITDWASGLYYYNIIINGKHYSNKFNKL